MKEALIQWAWGDTEGTSQEISRHVADRRACHERHKEKKLCMRRKSDIIITVWSVKEGKAYMYRIAIGDDDFRFLQETERLVSRCLEADGLKRGADPKTVTAGIPSCRYVLSIA